MDIPLLRAFVAVADAGSITRAAEALHLTQPTISKRIAQLESGLGKPLFNRLGRELPLAEAGVALLPHARAVLAELASGQRALAQLHDVVAGRLAIGTSHHIGLHRLPAVLKAFTLRHPAVDLDIQFMDSEVACEAVLAGKLELGIVTLPTVPLAKLRTRLVWPDPLSVVVAPSHPLAALKRPRLTSLAAHPAVLPDAGTYTHRIVKAALQAHGVTPQVRLATNFLETLKMLVAIGLGWSVLPRSMLDDSLIALPIKELALTRELGVVWHERRALGNAARALMQLLPEHRE